MIQCFLGYLCTFMMVRQTYQLLPTMILAKNNRHDAFPLGHLNGAARIHVHAHVSVEPSKSQHKVVRTVLDPDEQTL